MPLHDGMDHYYKTNFLDAVFYTGLWPAGSRRREVFHAGFLCEHVDFPGDALYFPLPEDGFWSYRGVDWHVYGLDGAGNCIHSPVSQEKMAELSGYRLKGRPAAERSSSFPAALLQPQPEVISSIKDGNCRRPVFSCYPWPQVL